MPDVVRMAARLPTADAGVCARRSRTASLTRERTIRVTLHFLEPNVEVHLSDELLEPARVNK